MRAQSEMNRTIRFLESLKAESGQKEKEIIEAIQKEIHKDVNIIIKKSGGINRLQFLQNLVDRMRHRLFDDSKDSTMLEDFQVMKIANYNNIKFKFYNYLNSVNGI
jgi:hypothetical protein